MKHKGQTFMFVLCVFFLKHKGQTYFNSRYDTYNTSESTAFLDVFNNEYITTNWTETSITFYALNLKTYNKVTGIANKTKTYQWLGNNFALCFD